MLSEPEDHLTSNGGTGDLLPCCAPELEAQVPAFHRSRANDRPIHDDLDRRSGGKARLARVLTEPGPSLQILYHPAYPGPAGGAAGGEENGQEHGPDPDEIHCHQRTLSDERIASHALALSKRDMARTRFHARAYRSPRAFSMTTCSAAKSRP